MVIGGSLGAKSINDAITNGLFKFNENEVQLIWQTGKNNATFYAKNASSTVWVNTFIEKMEMAYSAADIIISRAGAMSVAEICVAQKPVVFVPYPFAAEDHQTVNAQHLVDKKAALLVKDNEANEKLIDNALSLVNDANTQQTMQKHLASLAITNADEIIASSILKFLYGR